jgi:hypothetical protein
LGDLESIFGSCPRSGDPLTDRRLTKPGAQSDVARGEHPGVKVDDRPRFFDSFAEVERERVDVDRSKSALEVRACSLR